MKSITRGYYTLLCSYHEFDKNAKSLGMNAVMLYID